MSEPSFDEKLRSAFRDLDLIKSGWRPSEVDLADAVPLDRWWPITHRELGLPSLAGFADHPRLGRDLITTSPVLWIDDRMTVARCLSRWYRLRECRDSAMQIRLTNWEQVEQLRRQVENTLAMSVRFYPPRSGDPS